MADASPALSRPTEIWFALWPTYCSRLPWLVFRPSPAENAVTSLLKAALDYLGREFSVIPIRPDDRKRPALAAWKPYQERRATKEELQRWFQGKSTGIAVVCGRVSGGLTVIDIDDPDLALRTNRRR